VARDHGAAGTSRGTIGPRQCDIDHLSRQRHSQATHLVLVAEAGPWGSGRDRDLTSKGETCGVVAPSLMPQTSGDRVKTDRRDAVARARVRRSGDLTPVAGPAGADAAIRELRRAREQTRSALKAATFRRHACWLRHDSRDTGRATWNPAHLRGLAEVGCATAAHPIVFHA
jgi:transposase